MLNGNLPAPQARAARATVPYRAHFIVTHKCNLACAHCYQAEHDSEDLSTAEVFDTLAQLAKLGTLFLVLGGGEPLARRDFWEILAEARRLRFSVELYTNGTLITPDVAARLKAAGVTNVSVSLHGAHADSHDLFVRRRGSFDRVNRAIDALEAVGVPVWVKSSITSLNHREVPKLVQLFAGRKGVGISLNAHLFPRDDGDATPASYRMSEPQEHGKVRHELSLKSAAEMEVVLAKARVSLAAEESAHVPCQATRTGLAIHPNGDVTPCTQTAGQVMGNVRQRRVAEIWGSSAVGDKFRAIRLSDFTSNAQAPCGTCELRKLCSRCPAMSLAESGSLTGFSPQVCQSTKVYWAEVKRRAGELGLESPV